MKILTELYKKLKTLFNRLSLKSKNNKKYELSEKDIKGSLIFNLHKDSNVDILCYIPDTKDMDNDKLTQEAENFGNFISSITDGAVSDTIVKLLDKTKKDTKNPHEQLFIENILFFWAMTHVNRKAEKEKRLSSKPMIKPTAVFSQTKPTID